MSGKLGLSVNWPSLMIPENTNTQMAAERVQTDKRNEQISHEAAGRHHAAPERGLKVSGCILQRKPGCSFCLE